jgi:hypothetical protein
MDEGIKKFLCRELSRSTGFAFQLGRLYQETTAWHPPGNSLRSCFLEKAEDAFRPVLQKQKEHIIFGVHSL